MNVILLYTIQHNNIYYKWFSCDSVNTIEKENIKQITDFLKL